jgi:hypothetical protein
MKTTDLLAVMVIYMQKLNKKIEFYTDGDYWAVIK